MTQPSQPLLTYFQKDATTIRDDILRTEKNGLIALGIANPNVGPGSDYYTRATAVGNELAVVHANNVVKADQNMPDTAGGPDLDRWLNLLKLSRRGATGSIGLISAPCSVSSVGVPSGSQLTDSAGLVYEILSGGTYTAAQDVLTIAIFAVDTGVATDHQNGDALQWITPPPFCAQQVTVGTLGGADGLSGGFDSEATDDESPRGRLFQVFQSPPRAGNASDVATWCAAATPSVQAGFVYPALLGPGTTFVAVMAQAQSLGALSSTSKNRDLPAALVNGTVAPYVRGLYPENTQLALCSIASQANDIAILLAIPDAGTASPPGPGGGWLDGSPWPNSVGGTAPAVVAHVVSTTQFDVTVPSTNPPQAGISHIAFLSPLDWQLYTAIVTAVGTYGSPTAGAYRITVDTPMIGIVAGNYVFPQSVNQQIYVNAILGAFAGLGPGEWLTPGDARLTRAFRHPRSSLVWPANLDARFLKQLENASPEVEAADWIYRLATTPTVPSSITVDPTSGLITSAAPGVFTPRNIGMYAQ